MALDKQIVDRWQKSQILLLGGSAGSFKIIFTIIKNLGPDIKKPVIIIIHRGKNFFSEIEKLFAENSRMLLMEISDKDKILDNTIYIAPANYHVLIEKQKYFSLDVSDAIWFSKPSIDVSFESAAEVHKDQCTAILLSGANQDGAEGLLKLRKRKSLTIVQDPKEAEMPQMPQAAIDIGAAEFILKQDQILELLNIKCNLAE